MLPHCKGFLLITAKHNIKLQSTVHNEKVVLLNTVISLVLESWNFTVIITVGNWSEGRIFRLYLATTLIKDQLNTYAD